jgi:hypothetical protein
MGKLDRGKDNIRKVKFLGRKEGKINSAKILGNREMTTIWRVGQYWQTLMILQPEG